MNKQETIVQKPVDQYGNNNGAFDKTILYALFEEADGGMYGDTLVSRKLYTLDEAVEYVRKHAIYVYPEKALYRRGVACQFRAASRTCYGDGTFYFVEMVA